MGDQQLAAGLLEGVELGERLGHRIGGRGFRDGAGVQVDQVVVRIREVVAQLAADLLVGGRGFRDGVEAVVLDGGFFDDFLDQVAAEVVVLAGLLDRGVGHVLDLLDHGVGHVLGLLDRGIGHVLNLLDRGGIGHVLNLLDRGIGHVLDLLGRGVGHVLNLLGRGIGHVLDLLDRGIGHVLGLLGRGIGHVLGLLDRGIGHVLGLLDRGIGHVLDLLGRGIGHVLDLFGRGIGHVLDRVKRIRGGIARIGEQIVHIGRRVGGRVLDGIGRFVGGFGEVVLERIKIEVDVEAAGLADVEHGLGGLRVGQHGDERQEGDGGGAEKFLCVHPVILLREGKACCVFVKVFFGRVIRRGCRPFPCSTRARASRCRPCGRRTAA